MPFKLQSDRNYLTLRFFFCTKAEYMLLYKHEFCHDVIVKCMFVRSFFCLSHSGQAT